MISNKIQFTLQIQECCFEACRGLKAAEAGFLRLQCLWYLDICCCRPPPLTNVEVEHFKYHKRQELCLRTSSFGKGMDVFLLCFFLHFGSISPILAKCNTLQPTELPPCTWVIAMLAKIPHPQSNGHQVTCASHWSDWFFIYSRESPWMIPFLHRVWRFDEKNLIRMMSKFGISKNVGLSVYQVYMWHHVSKTMCSFINCWIWSTWKQSQSSFGQLSFENQNL